METISVIVPTRKRSEQFSNFASSLIENAAFPENLELVALIDEDDDSYGETIEMLPKIKWIISQRVGIGKLTTKGIENSIGDIIFLCNDDVDILSQNWDVEIRAVHKKYPDKVYLAGPNDMSKGASLFVFPIFSREVFTALNQFTIHYTGAYIDTHIFEIFSSLKHSGFDRLEFLESVHFKHNHYTLTGAEPDQVYADRPRFNQASDYFLLVRERLTGAQNLRRLILSMPLPEMRCKPHRGGFFNSLRIYLGGVYLNRLDGVKVCLHFLPRIIMSSIVDLKR